MIIAAWPGTGKSFLGNRYENILDAETTKFQFIVNDKLERSEIEKQKKTVRTPNPEWPNNYLKYLLDNSSKYDIIFIPPHPEILDYLSKHNYDFTLVVPNKDLKEEYKKRYINRGNNDSYIDTITTKWEYGLNILEKYDNKKIILNKGEYLLDYINKLGIKLISKKKELSVKFPARLEGMSLHPDYLTENYRLGGGYGFTIAMGNYLTIENKQEQDTVITDNIEAKKLIEYYLPIFKKKFLVDDNFKVELEFDKVFTNHSGLAFNINIICALAYCFRDLYLPEMSNDKLIKYLYTVNKEINDGKICNEMFTGIGHNCAFYGGITFVGKYGKITYHHSVPKNYMVVLVRTNFKKKELSSYEIAKKCHKDSLISLDEHKRIINSMEKELKKNNISALRDNYYLQKKSVLRTYIDSYDNSKELLKIMDDFAKDKDNIVGITYSKPNIYIITPHFGKLLDKVKKYNYPYSIHGFENKGIIKEKARKF